MADAAALHRLQEESFRRADGALRGSLPLDHTMGVEELGEFLDDRTYCVLATTTSGGRPQARPVAFTYLDGSFWFATVAGGRLRNVEREPWVSVVISEGEGEQHRMVAVDGPVTVHPATPDGLPDLWTRRMGSPAAWAVAWIRLEPARLFSYTTRA